MKFFLTGILVLVSLYTLKAQTKNQHIIGLNAEYSTMPKIVGKRLGTNLTYIYGYKRFCSKLELGILPNTNFGTVVKGCISVGLTTDLNTAISVHALGGILVLEGDKSNKMIKVIIIEWMFQISVQMQVSLSGHQEMRGLL